ncbi:MAG: hypothetical protein GYA36_05530 [Veillonellaceae bacterium]|nr:hypothetical protein [Veillonellaceae bacterium]
MSTITFGLVADAHNYANLSVNPVGWNAEQKVFWGNTAADLFAFTNDEMVTAFTTGQMTLQGGGGADTLSFSAADGNDLTFNFGYLDFSKSGQTYHVEGSDFNDTFQWTGSNSTKFTAIDGGAGNDTLTFAGATSGVKINLSDSIFANLENIIGSSYADTLNGSSISEVIDGAGGKDRLWGGAGSVADVLTGGADADTYYFGTGEGADTITGSTTDNANDVVRLNGVNFADLTFGQLVSASDTEAVIGFKDTTGYSGTLTLADFQTYSNDAAKRVNKFITDDLTFGLAIASNTATNLTGTTLADYLLGGTGADTLTAGASDSLFGGAGNDILNYFATAAYFDGGSNVAGGDTLTAATLTAGVEINLYDSKFKNIEVLNGSSLNDTLRGSTVAEAILGVDGADILWGGEGAANDTLTGGVGADTFWFKANEGLDSIVVEATTANAKSDVVRLDGLNFADLTFGVVNAANDGIIGFKDTTGYEGSLTIGNFAQFSNSAANRINKFVTDDLTFGLAIATATSTSLAGTTLNEYLMGGVGNDTLTAGAGDTLFGGVGNDILNYFATASSFDGGANDDTLTGVNLTSAMDVNLYDSAIKNIEVLVGTSLNDVLRGSTLNNTLEGGRGADHLWGNQGNDVLTGGAGADTYWFGQLDGIDTITEGGANDASDVVKFKELTFSQLTFGMDATKEDLEITVDGDSATKLVLTDWVINRNATNSNRISTFVTEDLTFGLAIANDDGGNLWGTAQADWIVGGAGADSIGASAGADTISTAAGDDTITYRATAATIDGGEGTDTLNAASASAAVDIDLRNVDATLTNFANIEYVAGSLYNDILRGSSNAETLVGGSGNDALWGAAENDTLEGGAGADTYWFGGSDGSDVIVSATTNSIDTVVFSSINGVQIGGADLKTVELSGDNLVITLSTDDSLTLNDWNLGSGNKLNKFNFGDNGNYSLAFTDGAAVWTKLS